MCLSSIKNKNILKSQSLRRMVSWEEIDSTLIQLFPGDAARGRVRRALRKALLDLDEPFSSRHFKDNNAAVKAALDALTGLGIFYFANQRLTSKPNCDLWSSTCGVASARAAYVGWLLLADLFSAVQVQWQTANKQPWSFQSSFPALLNMRKIRRGTFVVGRVERWKRCYLKCVHIGQLS